MSLTYVFKFVSGVAIPSPRMLSILVTAEIIKSPTGSLIDISTEYLYVAPSAAVISTPVKCLISLELLLLMFLSSFMVPDVCLS